MPHDDRAQRLKRSVETLHDTVQRGGSAAMASYSLIGAILLLGGIGFAVDHWAGTGPWGLVVGLGLGLVVGFYQLAVMLWRRQ